MKAQPQSLGFEVFLTAVYLCTVWIPAATGLNLSLKSVTLSALTNPFSPINRQVMKVFFPSAFAFASVAVLAMDPGVPGWVGLLDALIVFGLLAASVTRGLSKKPSATAQPTKADGLDYPDRLHRLEDSIIRDTNKPPQR